jgi:hypothetical protein
VLASVSDLRAEALAAAGSAAASDEAAARSRYVVAVAAHSEGQASAMRLCLKRLTFCAKAGLSHFSQRYFASQKPHQPTTAGMLHRV